MAVLMRSNWVGIPRGSGCLQVYYAGYYTAVFQCTPDTLLGVETRERTRHPGTKAGSRQPKNANSRELSYWRNRFAKMSVRTFEGIVRRGGAEAEDTLIPPEKALGD